LVFSTWYLAIVSITPQYESIADEYDALKKLQNAEEHSAAYEVQNTQIAKNRFSTLYSRLPATSRP
jgi:hypothetical protein